MMKSLAIGAAAVALGLAGSVVAQVDGGMAMDNAANGSWSNGADGNEMDNTTQRDSARTKRQAEERASERGRTQANPNAGLGGDSTTTTTSTTTKPRKGSGY